MKKISLLILAAGFIFACNQEKKGQQGSEVVASKVDSLNYKVDSVVVYSKNIIKAENNTTDTTKATFIFPVFEDKKLNDFIKRQVFNYIGKDEQVTSYQDIANSFVKGYDDFYVSNTDRTQTWWLMIKLSVLYHKADYISIQYVNSDFSGGAHPNTYFSFLNYNTKANQPITLDSLIQPKQKQQLIALAEAKFRKDENLNTKESLSGKYFFKDDKFALPENFYVNKEGLVFLYNPYEIKPYVEGTTKLIIPFSALKGIAKPNTILTTTTN